MRLLLPILVALALLPLFPGATAQPLGGPPTVEIKVYAPTEPLMPQVGFAEVKIDVIVGCTMDDARGEPTTVKLSAGSVPHYASYVIEPHTHTRTYDAQSCMLGAPTKYSFPSIMRISLSR